MKFNVLTVPHSGSRFLMRFFSFCDMHRYSCLSPEQPQDYDFNHFWHLGIQNSDRLNNTYSYEKSLPVVCTLRHPYSVAVSWLTRGKDINDMFSCYRQFVIFAENHRVFLFDVESPQKYRETALRNVLMYCNTYEDRDEKAIKLYAERWEPVGSKGSDIKEEYMQNDTLPKYNWARLDGLVKWYNARIQEFNYDNIS